LRHALRASDTVARVGGDEFIVLQTGIAQSDDARLLASRLIRVVSAPYAVDGHTVHVGVSAGVALAPGDGEELDHLTSYADAALYRAKHAGRGCVVLWRESEPADGAAMTA
jgi:diguanylate cyclase (GGDEF)-like protein